MVFTLGVSISSDLSFVSILSAKVILAKATSVAAKEWNPKLHENMSTDNPAANDTKSIAILFILVGSISMNSMYINGLAYPPRYTLLSIDIWKNINTIKRNIFLIIRLFIAFGKFICCQIKIRTRQSGSPRTIAYFNNIFCYILYSRNF